MAPVYAVEIQRKRITLLKQNCKYGYYEKRKINLKIC